MSINPSKTLPQINDCSFQLDFSDGKALIKESNMKVGKSSFSITGTIMGWNELKGDLKIHSDYLDLSELLPMKEFSSVHDHSEGAPGFMDHFNIAMQTDVTAGTWRKLPFGPAKADLIFDNENIIIKDSQVNLDRGDLTIRGHMLKNPDPEMFFTGDVHINDKPIDELLDEVEINYKGLKGPIMLNGTFSAKGKDKKDLISNLNGSLNVSITQGLIKNPNVIIKVLDFLSLQKIFEQRPADLKEEGLYFENLSGDAVIEQGVLKSENFVMRSPVMNAVANGRANLAEGTVDFIMGAQPHGTIDSLLSKIPILGYIITGENKSIVAYPFEVKGISHY
jgi:hypothetical protein